MHLRSLDPDGLLQGGVGRGGLQDAGGGVQGGGEKTEAVKPDPIKNIFSTSYSSRHATISNLSDRSNFSVVYFCAFSESANTEQS